jgi:DNA-binding HxlR family transcriptional regulator
VHQTRRQHEEIVLSSKLEKTFTCPTEFTLRVLGGKWKTVILCFLKIRPLRYAELRKLIPALSDKVLSERLGELVDTGLVSRQTIGKEKAEVYKLSARGQSLSNVLDGLYRWGETHADEFGVSTGRPFLKAGLSMTAREFTRAASKTKD